MHKKIVLTLSTIILILGINACKHTTLDNLNLTENGNYSTSNSDESRRMSGDCMKCHGAGGSVGDNMTLGGSVYKDNGTGLYPNTKIYLYSGPNGTGQLLKTIEVDGVGNFYSSAKYNFNLALFPVVEGKNGAKRYMGTALTNGSCNSCHGVSTDKITAD
jgi:cytochrome c553